MSYLRAAVRAFEMSLKLRVVNPFTYMGWVIYPSIYAVLALLLLSHGGAGRSAYAFLGGGLLGFWGVAYVEGGQEIQNERWSGTLEQVMGCPTPMVVIVIGKLWSAMLFGALSFVPTILIAYFAWHLSLQHVDFFALAVSMAVLVLAFFAITLALVPLYTMWRWAFSLTNGFEIGIYALCGFVFPITLLPAWLQSVAAILAPAWATRAVYAATGQPYGHDYLAWWAISIGLSLVYLTIGWFGFKAVDSRARVSGQLGFA